MSASLKIGIIADYNPANESHAATEAALEHAASALGQRVETVWLATEELPPVQDPPAALPGHPDAIWIGPGSPYRDPDRALAATRWARESGLPFFAT